IPQISISPAPPEEYYPEPSSPFRSISFATPDDGFRPTHLTPPPTVTNFKRPLSPLNPADAVPTGKGLENDRFQALLSASKAYSGGKRAVDLRKEIALKVHKNKQVERRALFLSKVQAPPSPTATITPKTPPESPAILHYSLPSPGLVSPLALFESLNENYEGIRPSWVEQVDFRLPEDNCKPKARQTKPSHGLPSLDQISARLIPQSAKPDTVAFPSLNPANVPRPRPFVGVGRLRMPLRTQLAAPQPVTHTAEQPKPALPPKSPLLHLPPEIRVTTLVVSRTNTTPSVELTENNLNAFNSRDQRAHHMLLKLRRRTLSSECMFTTPLPKEEVDYKWRRRSAPADLMPLRPRAGFGHPVLALPGGF
ncbi:hypothetical protein BDZ97DRAFT_1634426, partial [Flammula alnicola]